MESTPLAVAPRHSTDQGPRHLVDRNHGHLDLVINVLDPRTGKRSRSTFVPSAPSATFTGRAGAVGDGLTYFRRKGVHT